MAAVTPSPFAESAVAPQLGSDPGGGDAFDLFQIEPAFDLDLEALAQRHRDLSRALHPDRYVGRSAAERRQALSRAIEVNAAWRVLRDPLERARALLGRLGVATEGEGRAPADPDFLMEMMERREALRELGRQKDVRGIDALSQQVRADERRLLEQVAVGFRKAFEQGQPAVVTELDRWLGELRYFRRFFDEADALLDD